MHVHELNPWRTLIVLSLFAVLLIVGFFTMYEPQLTFKKDLQESLADVWDSEALFYPWQLEAVISGEDKNVILMDIRDNFVYGQGNIPGSENISAYDLTLSENIERLNNLNKGNITVVLYGDNQLQANGPWMLFRQMGLSNVKILPGGYQYYLQHKDNLAETMDDPDLITDIPRHNFAEIASPENGAVADQQVEKKQVTVVRQQKTNVASGGC